MTTTRMRNAQIVSGFARERAKRQGISPFDIDRRTIQDLILELVSRGILDDWRRCSWLTVKRHICEVARFEAELAARREARS